MNKSIKAVLILCCSLSIFIYSCTKSNSSATGSDTDIQTSMDNSFAESTNNDVTTISAQSEDDGLAGSLSDSAFGYLLSPCATLSFDSSSVPHKITIDFGTDNCQCYDGKLRRGKILVAYTGHYRDSASTQNISFDNYYVNNYKVDGTQTVINNGHNAAGNLTFGIQANIVITDSTGKKLSYTSTRTREWVAGENTKGILGWKDDVYSITGTASGTSFNGVDFDAKITKPIIFALACRWIEAGTIDFTPSGKLTRTIDYGNGDCDNKATITVAGINFDITLL